MRRLLALLVMFASGCMSVAGMFSTPWRRAELRVIEVDDGQTARRAIVRCNYPIDEIDTFDAVALARPGAGWAFTDGTVKVSRTALCERLLAGVKTGCPCTGPRCIKVEGEPVCEPGALAELLEQSLWAPSVMQKLWTQPELPENALRLRWPSADQLLIGHGGRPNNLAARWSVMDASGARHRCVMRAPLKLEAGDKRHELKERAIALVSAPVDGGVCAFVGDALRISPATRERLAAVELELQVPISREWRKPLAQHDLWWIRARAESSPGR